MTLNIFQVPCPASANTPGDSAIGSLFKYIIKNYSITNIFYAPIPLFTSEWFFTGLNQLSRHFLKR